MPVRPVNQSAPPVSTLQQSLQGPMIKSEVTLNMLNAAESEVDVEGLHEEVKLEFDGGNEDVAT